MINNQIKVTPAPAAAASTVIVTPAKATAATTNPALKPAQAAAVPKAVPTVAAIKPVASTSTKVQPSVKSMPKLT